MLTRTNEEARPVSDWENQSVDGMALSCDIIHEADIEKIDQLRAQQKAYLDSLPTDPSEICAAAKGVLHPDSKAYPIGFEEALHLSHAIRPMVEKLDLSAPGPDRDAILWVADRIMFGLEASQRKLDHLAELLDTPSRLKRDARRASMKA